jgi:hypothetical protein
VTPARDFEDIPSLLKGGVSLPEAVIPKTRPGKAEQLTLFGDR